MRSNILVIDDTPANLSLLESMLREQGYEVRPFPNGRQALRSIENDPPDLILLDINMPEMNGFDVCRELKSREETRHIPVLFISALQNMQDKVLALDLGGVDYITKPFQLEEVLARVRTHLKIRKLQEDLRVQNGQLQTSLQQLRQLEQFRDNLIQMIVHDLRSPLTGMLGYLELLKIEDEGLSGRQLNCVSHIETNTQKLIRLINDLLDVGRLEANRMPLQLATVEVDSLSMEAQNILGSLAGDFKVVHVVEPPGLSVWVDPAIVRRVLANFLANAFKFSPPGSQILLTAKLQEAVVKFSVHDSGPGIPVEHRETIFEKFGQVAGQVGNGSHSTGLGLTFCKLAVEAHGGRIGVNCDAPQGSEFWFTIPADIPQ